MAIRSPTFLRVGRLRLPTRSGKQGSMLARSLHQPSFSASIASVPLDVEPPGLPVLRPAQNLVAPRMQITTLPNGFRVVSQESFGQVTTFALFIDAGSMYEEGPDERGVCHFIEASAFTSTRQRSAADVQANAQSAGISSQAVFNREVIMFKVRCTHCCSQFHSCQCILGLGASKSS